MLEEVRDGLADHVEAKGLEVVAGWFAGQYRHEPRLDDAAGEALIEQLVELDIVLRPLWREDDVSNGNAPLPASASARDERLGIGIHPLLHEESPEVLLGGEHVVRAAAQVPGAATRVDKVGA